MRKLIYDALQEKREVHDDMKLIGAESVLDSMTLVEVCLALEDDAEERGFDFDWTSDEAMSRARSMFRTVESLAAEFARQSNQ
ncbi:hypothetical protein [Pseudohaliea sp.]|uniref:hypothetical protein n=1 Tax=Pseudohaliea sp. TaxID=2740289 RepID=UPI0032EAB85E